MLIELLLTLTLFIASFIVGLITTRLKSLGKMTPIVFLCVLGFIQNYVFQYFETSNTLSFTISFFLVICNIFGRSLQMIGLTGGIACGKSQIVKILKEQFKEIGIIDCDQIAKEVIEPRRRAYKALVKTFGPEIVLSNGGINREALGNLIFSNREARRKLDRIVQPYIFFEVIRKVLAFRLKRVEYIVMDAPLLFEAKVFKYFCYPIVTVYIKEPDLWIKRLCQRDKIDADKAKSKILCQMRIEEKLKMSQVGIDNSGTVAELETTVKKVFSRICKSWFYVKN